MNSFPGHITSVQVAGNLSMVNVDLGQGLTLKAIVIETPETASYLCEGHAAKALFKETEVMLATRDVAISVPNQLPGSVKNIEKGILLTKVVVETIVGQIVAVVPTSSVYELGLATAQSVKALIKVNEIMLADT